MALFEQAAAAQTNRLMKGGCWPCCLTAGRSASGCCHRKIHSRSTNDVFCFGCGVHYNLSHNVQAMDNQTKNCSRHPSTPKLVRGTSNSHQWRWGCCSATGLEASIVSSKSDMQQGYTWGCEQGYHYGVPTTVQIEVEERIVPNVQNVAKAPSIEECEGMEDLDSDDDFS